ncbi:MAG: hypothetical protein M0004_09900 [Actinomycetota bacterium]|nr:hypothetical protein [Actinomycetota bacterium]
MPLKAKDAGGAGCIGCLFGGPLMGIAFVFLYVFLYVALPLALLAGGVMVVVGAFATVGVAGASCLLVDLGLRVFPSYRARRVRKGPVTWPKRALAEMFRSFGSTWDKQKALRPAQRRSRAEGAALATVEAPLATPSLVGELERLEQLHSSGALSDEEYASAKGKLLG